MKIRKLLTWTLLPALLIFCLIPACRAEAAGGPAVSFGTFSGAKPVNASLSPDGAFGAPWYYEETTLPEGIEGGGVREELILLSPDGSGEERITAASVDFVSGDEALRDALSLLTDGGPVFLTDLNAAPSVGEAVFRVRAESENLYAETEFTLRKLSWEEYPLFVFRRQDRSAEVALGSGDVAADGTIESWKPLSGLYTAAQLASLLVEDRAAGIAARVLPEEARQAFSAARESRFSVSGDVPEDRVRSVSVAGDGGRNGIQFLEYGNYDFLLEDSVFGLSCSVTLRALSYGISGPSFLPPGGTGTWRIRDARPEDGRTFAWSADGAEAVFSGDSAVVTVPADAPEGASFTLTTVPDDGEPVASFTCSVSGGVLSGLSFRGVSMAEGFTVPVPDESAGFSFTMPDPQTASCERKDAGAPYVLYLDYKVFNARNEFAEDADAAALLYTQNRFNLGAGVPEDVLEESVSVGGHPAALLTARVLSSDGDYFLGAVFCARNDRVLRIRLASRPADGASPDSIPPVTMGDLRTLASRILYDPSLASITVEDGAVSLTAQGNAEVLSAGKRLRFSASFANPARVNRKARNDALEWSVTDAETGEPAADVTVDRRGTVSAGRKLSETGHVLVTVSSPVFHTSASYPLTVLPAVSKLSVEPRTLVFYEGENRTEIVRVSLTPETAEPVGLVWQARPDGVAQVADTKNGTALVRPGKPGKATVTVKEPGGKSAGLSVSVLIPVEAVELTVKGKPRPGGTVTCSAALRPRNAGNRNLEWSLDVGEDVASVNARGQVRISRTVPEGTVITVTCRALGSPRPVTAEARITVGD